MESKKYSIEFTSNDLTEGILKVTSSIRTDKIYTLSKYIVVKKFGCINDKIIEQVRLQINKLLEQ